MSSAQVMYPALHYRDAPAALRWMKETLGAEEVLVVPDGDRIAHAEVRIAGGVADVRQRRERARSTAARPAPARSTSRSTTSTRCTRASSAAGGEVVMGLTDTDYGSRDFTLRDPEGNIWNFGTYRP